MNITKTSEGLTQTQKQAIFNLWNNEYPHQLAFSALADVDAYLSNLHHQTHYFVMDEAHKILGWACKFDREGEKWFAMILDCSVHQKGIGTKLLNQLKPQESILNGWVIDHERYTKATGERYPSPLGFYVKNEFTVCNERRLEIETLSAVNIKWEKPEVKIVTYNLAHQNEIDLMMQEITAEFLLPPPHATYKPNLPDFYWVVLFNGKLVGTVALNKVGRYGVLKRMFLREKYRGGGISSLMLATVLECCRSERLDTLYLGTIHQFVAAQKFYVKNGFTKIEQEALPVDFPHNPIDTLFYVRNSVTH